MFFAPPKVKSLSRYAEYGAYLGNKHFLVMLAVAFTAHLSVIAVYSMMPAMEIIRIPVHPLNIKLTDGAAGGNMQTASAAFAPVARAPSEDKLVAVEPSQEDMKPVDQRDVESTVDKGIATRTHPKPAHTHTQQEKRHTKESHESHKEKPAVHHNSSQEMTFATPKKYVRADESSAAGNGGRGKAGTGNGSDVGGNAGGDEIIERYTQKISQWIKNHQMEARTRCEQAKEVTGECDAKGDVVVRIRIDRDGHILYNSVDRTSGKELVDQLAIQIVRASDPVPAVPVNYPSDSQLEFLVTVQVDLTARR